MLNRTERVLREEWGSLSELMTFVELGSLYCVHLHSSIFLSIPFHFRDVADITVSYQVSFLQKISSCCAPAVPVLCRSASECHRAASTALSVCPTQTPTGSEPSHGGCRWLCLSKLSLTPWVHQRVIHCNTTAPVPGEKFTYKNRT